MTGAARPDPRKAARETIRLLRSLRDPALALSGKRFFKEPVALLGIPAPVVHRVTRDRIGDMRAAWTVDDAVLFCDLLAKDPHLETRTVGFLALGAFVDKAGPPLLPKIRSWLATGCGNWAAVDTLAPRVLGPFLDRHPRKIETVVGWTASKNMWVRRGAAVAFVNHARKGKHLDAVYEIAERLFGDDEDLMHKAVGWLLREAGKADTPRLERFLRKHGPRIPRTTLRYAIERFPERERRELLRSTRGETTRARSARTGASRAGSNRHPSPRNPASPRRRRPPC